MENRIELIKSRLLNATKGKWEFIEQRGDIMPSFESEKFNIMDFGIYDDYYPVEGRPPLKNDIEFIVNAKSDIEFLLCLVEEQNSIIMDFGLRENQENEQT